MLRKTLLFKISLIAVLVTILLCLVFITPNVVCASSKVNISNSDRDQIETIICDFAEQDGFILEKLNYIIDNVYFSNEEWAGYVIDFVDEKNMGYAIVFKVENEYELVEINFGTKSPFLGKDGFNIYPSLGYYIVKIDNFYYNAVTMDLLVDYKPTSEIEFFAANNKDKTNVKMTRNIEYSRGNITEYEIDDFYVNYSTSLTKHTNNCANAAGLIALNYWNKKYDNDLLKLDETLLYKNNIYGNENIDARKDYMNIFYKYMNTNWFLGTGGTLPVGCYNGFERLIKENKYNISRKVNLSYQQIKESISNDIPIFIVSTDYYFSCDYNKNYLPSVSSISGENTLNINYEHSWGIAQAHTFVGYGYAYYDLYDSNNKVKQEQLIKIANGWGGSCYFNFSISNKYSTAAINVYK